MHKALYHKLVAIILLLFSCNSNHLKMNKKIVKFEYYPKTYLTGDEKINYNISTTKISIEDHNKLSIFTKFQKRNSIVITKGFRPGILYFDDGTSDQILVSIYGCFYSSKKDNCIYEISNNIECDNFKKLLMDIN